MTRTQVFAYQVKHYRDEAAQMIYQSVYDGYDTRSWDDLPTHRKWRWIKATTVLCDFLERTVSVDHTPQEEANAL